MVLGPWAFNWNILNPTDGPMAASSAFSGLGYRSAAGAHGGQMLLWKLSCHLLCWFVQQWRTLFRNDPKWQFYWFPYIFPYLSQKMRIHHGIRRLFLPQSHSSRSWVNFLSRSPTDHLKEKKFRHHPMSRTSPVFLDTISSKGWLLSDWDFLCRLTHEMCCQRTIVGVEGM